MNYFAKFNGFRRGNALILVVGILVLLVLVATAFITKTQSGRVTSIAQQDSAQINDRNLSTIRAVANETGVALFPRPVVSTFEASNNSANARRSDPSILTPRYGHDSAYPFNFAPYEVIPWTNPPDDDQYDGIPLLGPYNPLGGPSFGDSRWLRDTEPLRADFVDLIGQGGIDWSGYSVDGTPETFTHWRHLTNISRSGNAVRIVKNISDIVGYGLVTDLDVPVEQWPIWRPLKRNGSVNVGPIGYPSMDLMDLGDLNSSNWREWGSTNGEELLTRYDYWQTLAGWGLAQNDASLLPPNFLDLSDLDGDGIHNEAGERPVDAFVRGSPRWYAEIAMTDADGDGFTDSFWNIHPQQLDPDVKQIYAVSITDNSARGNMNVATRFHRKDYYGTDNQLNQHGEATRGHTPADLAIVGQNDRSFQNITPWRVGFMDNLANLPGNANYSGNPWVAYSQIGTVDVDWNTNQWQDQANASLLDELGIEINESGINTAVFADPTGGALSPSGDITSRYGRLWYWQLAGRDPFSATSGLRPFTLSDELELRIAEGNNYQFVGSRFERSVNNVVGGTPTQQFLRSDYVNRHEASELRDQLDNRQLLFDNRRKLTMFSGVRNDLLAPWLRWEDRFWLRHDPGNLGLPYGYDAFNLYAYETAGIPEPIRPAVFGSAFPSRVTMEGIQAAINNGPDALDQVIENWRNQSRQKVDLRSYYADSSFLSPWWEANDDGLLTLAERAPLQVLLAFTDSQESGNSDLDGTSQNSKTFTGEYNTPDPSGVFDDFDENYYQQARVAAAGFSANLLSYRDDDDEWRMHSMLPDYIFDSTSTPRIQVPLSGAIEPPIIGRQDNDSESPQWGTYVPYDDAPVAGPNETHVRMLGMEAQPFILETMIAHVHQAKVPGDQGACCLDSGLCVDISEETCFALLGGDFFEGEVCDPNGDGDLDDGPCQNQGACCIPDGGCVFTTQSRCEAQNGQFLGVAIPCTNVTCLGACCFDDGSCQNISGGSCTLAGGSFAGYLTDCSIGCALAGSCCLPSGSCVELYTEDACNELNGTNWRSGGSCFGDPCISACCVDFSTCVETTEYGCIDVLGEWQGYDIECVIGVCDVAGACCLGSETCQDVNSLTECNDLNGVFLAGSTCSTAPCSGSCCLPLGECDDTSLPTCLSLAGDYIPGAFCIDAPCEGACCFNTGDCLLLYRGACEDLGGTYNAASDCDTSTCGVLAACCLPETIPDPPKTVTILQVENAFIPDNVAVNVGDTIEWIWNSGTHETVDSNIGTCDVVGVFFQFDLSEENDVVEIIVEADWPSQLFYICNDSDHCDVMNGIINVTDQSGDGGGGCIETSETGCTTLGGEWLGSEFCGSQPCGADIRGGCCLETGLCLDVTSNEICVSLGGIYQGDLVSCASEPCLPGACCLGSLACLETIEENCLNLLGVFFSGESCEGAGEDDFGPCERACCLPDGTCEDLFQDTCENVLGGTFNPSESCGTEPCVATGACCISANECDDIPEDACISLGGIWSGVATVCADDPCAFGGEGACCFEPLGCVRATEATCLQIDGIWDGTADCDVQACNEGACCLDNGKDSSCVQVVSSNACALLGGFYNIGQECDDGPCEGACCFWGGGCEVTSRDSCLTWDDITGNPPAKFNGLGTVCGPIACDPDGSCCLPSGSCVDLVDERSFTDYCENLGGTWRPTEFCADTECIGACCLEYDFCTDVPESACNSLGGEYQGIGVFCSSDPCPDNGACCFDSGSCIEATETRCILLDGEFQGIGVVCDPDGLPGSGDEPCDSYFLLTNDTDDCPQETVSVVQLANPFDREIELNDYSVEFFGQDYKLDGLNLVLAPATPENPTTLILYAISSSSDIQDPNGIRDFDNDWLDFLDLEVSDHPILTQIHQVPGDWRTKRSYYDGLTKGEQNSVAVYRFDKTTDANYEDQRVLIDRLDRPGENETYELRVVDDLDDEWNRISDNAYLVMTDSDNQRILAAPDEAALFVQWDRATRAWAVDIPEEEGWHDQVISSDEINPRYISSAMDFIRSEESRAVTKPNSTPEIKYTSIFHWTDFDDPDDRDSDGNPDTAADPDLLSDNPDPWFTVETWSPRGGEFIFGSTTEGEVKGGLRIRKPFYFDMNHSEDPEFAISGGWSYPDKGWYGQQEDLDGDDTTSDSPAFADDVLNNEQIALNERNIPMAFPLQMLQKDDDYEQVGELMNLWLFGHMLEGSYAIGSGDNLYPAFTLPISYLDSGGGDISESALTAGTVTTFSEFMDPRWGSYGDTDDWWAPWVAIVEDGELSLDARINRLRYAQAGDDDLPMMLGGRSVYDDTTGSFGVLNHAWPRLPAAARVLDSFVCDGPGRPDFIDASTGTYGNDGIGDDLNPSGSNEYLPTWHSFYNANNFAGKATPGMININTAPLEVLRMLPHMYKVVHATDANDTGTIDTSDRNPRSLLPESIIQWREGANGGPDPYTGNGFTGGPDFSDREFALGLDYGNGPKGTRGFSSPAEIGLLTVSGDQDDILEPWHINNRHQAVRDADSWRVDFAGREPFGDPGTSQSIDWIGDGVGAKISTDVISRNYYGEDTVSGDGISGDAEELNMLQAGISNLVSTTSDIFTVHLRIRTFRRNSITGIWDATDSKQIVDDSRYVLLVDRSNVNSPADKPKILYYEKLPN